MGGFTSGIPYLHLVFRGWIYIYSVPWGYHDKCGGFFEYRVFGTMGGIMRTVRGYLAWGDIMSTVGGVQYHGDIILNNLSTVENIMIHVGGYHEYRGGTQITKDFFSHSTEHPRPPWYS